MILPGHMELLNEYIHYLLMITFYCSFECVNFLTLKKIVLFSILADWNSGYNLP